MNAMLTFEDAFRRAMRAARVGEYDAYLLVRRHGADVALVELTARALDEPELVDQLADELHVDRSIGLEVIALPILAAWSSSAQQPSVATIGQLARQYLVSLARSSLRAAKLRELGLTDSQVERLMRVAEPR